MTVTRAPFRAFALAALAALSGCVLRGTPDRNSRFAADISSMQRAEQSDFPHTTWVYRHPTRKPTDFARLQIAPVAVYENTAHKTRAEDRPEFNALAAALSQRLLKTMSKDYLNVAKPASDTMRLEVEIVDVKPVVQMKKDGNDTTVLNPNMKGSKIEANFYDSMTNELILAVSTLYKGEEYDAYQDVSLTDNVSKAFDEWLPYFKKKVDEAMTYK